jgi:cell fate (sporulation/competence/biofilm development) regulator YlbF (YheA/YmcA/DUF963 family)
LRAEEIVGQLTITIKAYEVAAEALRAYVEPLFGSPLPEDYEEAKRAAIASLVTTLDRANAYKAEAKAENWAFSGMTSHLEVGGILKNHAEELTRALCDYEESAQSWTTKTGKQPTEEFQQLIKDHRQARDEINQVVRSIKELLSNELKEATTALKDRRAPKDRESINALFQDGIRYNLLDIGSAVGKNREQARSAQKSLDKEQSSERLIIGVKIRGNEYFFDAPAAREIAWKTHNAKPRGIAGQKANAQLSQQ